MTDHPTHPDRSTPPDEPGDALWRRVRRWAVRVAASGLAVSLLVHLLAGIVAAVVTVDYSMADAGGRTGPEIPFAVMTESELFEQDPAALAFEAEAFGEVSTLDAEPVEPLAELGGVESDAAIDDLADLQLDSNTGAGASGPPVDEGTAGLSGAGQGASFFGLEAQGKRFCYIVDMSTSMNRQAFDERTRMGVTKGELSRSVTNLLESSEFVVVLYAGGAATMTGGKRWTDATADNKLVARQRIGTIDPHEQKKFGIRSDGTQPIHAFRIALKLRPRPDAIYFMTDGEFSSDTADEIATLNESRRIPIHCILFNDPDAIVGAGVEPVMKRIAADSGGRYRAVKGGRP